MIEQLPKLDRRIPAWELDALVKRDCPFCGTVSEPFYVRPDDLKLSHCSNCDAWFVPEIPSQEQLTQFYDDYDRTHRNLPRLNPKKLLKRYQQADPLSDYRLRVLSNLTELAGARVLDVGFGRGYYLYQLQRLGAQVSGIELDPTAISFVKNTLGIADVRQADLFDLDEGAGFDVILLMDLIEHIIYPGRFLEKISRLLNSGGLVAVFTPNAGSAQQQDAPILFRVDLEHLQYMSEKTCHYVAEKTGLAVSHAETAGHPYLTNIVDTSAADFTTMQRIKHMIARIPGVEKAYGTMKQLRGAIPEPPGNYHLYFVLQKRGQV